MVMLFTFLLYDGMVEYSPISGENLMKQLAYSYIRFSSPEQAKGHSLERQTEAAAQWCRRHGAHLDESTTFRDLGTSGFTGSHGKNPDRHALAAFLKLVEQGRIPKGSYLIIENLDRLTREDERAALRLWMDILDAGINIVQLKPETIFRHEKSDMFDIMRAIMELSRGHGESLRKSTTMGPVWAKKKQQAGEKVVTNRLPLWVQRGEDGLEEVPERGAVIREMFRLAASGYGITSIIRHLTESKTPTFNDTGRWTRAYVYKILTDKRVVGEYQPYKGRRGPSRKTDGDPVLGYFPVVVGEELFNEVQGCLAGRKNHGGRIGPVFVNPFSGITFEAATGRPYYAAVRRIRTREDGSKKVERVLINVDGEEGRCPSHSFPYPVFERAIFSWLFELDPREILNGHRPSDDTARLGKQFAGVEAELEKLNVSMDRHGYSESLDKRIRKLEDQKRMLSEKLREARQKAAHPLSESWGEVKGILQHLDEAADPRDARLRLRVALKRIVDSVWLHVVPRGLERLVLVQVWFASEKEYRIYIIHYRRPYGNHRGKANPGGWRAESWREYESFGVPTGHIRDNLAEYDAWLRKLPGADQGRHGLNPLPE
jgi:DNA invertase Pin-like site-specific DNA recombinase